MAHSLVEFACTAALTLTCTAAATDRIVGPGGFYSLAAAIAAAQPGDRILLARSVNIGASIPALPANVTIESIAPGPRRSISLVDDFGIATTWSIQVGVTFRNVQIVCFDPGDFFAGAGGLIIHASSSDVVFEDVSITEDVTYGLGIAGSGAQYTMFSANVRELLMRRSEIVAEDGGEYSGATNVPTVRGTDALVVNARRVVLEDVELRGGDAPIVRSFDDVGRGGAALMATTQVTLLVRCDLRDGSGGYQNLGAPGDPLAPRGLSSSPGQSFFGGLQHASATDWTLGSCCEAPGVVAPTITVPLGEAEAPLVATGGELGGMTTVNVALPTNPAFTTLGFLVGAEFADPVLPTTLGTLLTVPYLGQIAAPGSTTNFPVPNNPSAIGQVFVFQAVLSPLRLGNPSWVGVHAP